MTSRTRLWILFVSTPVIAFAIIGGYLGQAQGRDGAYPQLAMFGDVLRLVLDNYVEPVDVRVAMRGGMRGLADGLDADSAYLPPDVTKTIDSKVASDQVGIGVELRRRYYLLIVSARDGSPAAKAGLRAGDYIRAVDGRPTRNMSALEGTRALLGAPGSKVVLLVLRGSTTDPHEVTLVRERLTGPDVTTRMANPSTGYVRIVEFSADTPGRVRQAFSTLARTGATRYVIDLRGTAAGDVDFGVAAARLFVKSGTLSVKESKDGKAPVTAQPKDGELTAPAVLLVDRGTAGAAELFAAALDGNSRADLVGENTLGRAGRQQLVKLPDGSALLLTSTRYLTPAGAAIHEQGLTPDLEVPQPDVEFGASAPTADPTLDAAVARLADKKAA